MLRDRLICGVSDTAIRKHLLMKGDELTLKDAIKDATTMEAVVKDSKNLGPLQGVTDKNSSGGVHNVRHRPSVPVHPLAKQPQGPGGKCYSGDSHKSCYRCGIITHLIDVTIKMLHASIAIKQAMYLRYAELSSKKTIRRSSQLSQSMMCQ